ncbi:Uncharacterized protein OBRU01_03726, partial [Operophtera brumata]
RVFAMVANNFECEIARRVAQGCRPRGCHEPATRELVHARNKARLRGLRSGLSAPSLSPAGVVGQWHHAWCHRLNGATASACINRRQSYVGRIKFSQFDTVSTAKKLIVATEENVLAALNLKTGQVVWRHVFESAATGNIQLLHVTDKVVTVSGSNPYLHVGFDISGVLLWEWSLTLQNDETAEFSEWWVENGLLVHMLPVFSSHVEVTMYNLVSDGNSGPGFILDDQKILLIKENQFEVVKVGVADPAASIAVVDGVSGPVLLQTWTDNVKGFQLTAHSITTGVALPDIQTSDRNLRIPEPEISAVLCSKAREHNICRILLTALDDATHLMQQGEKKPSPILWRSSSLTSRYPISKQLLNLSLTRRKIFGMDNLSGVILWHVYEANLDTDGVQVFTRRSARHPPHDAYLSVVGKHEETGNTMIISLNPITGTPAGEGTLHLQSRPLQCAMLYRPDKQKLHALLLLDNNEQVHVFPDTAASLVENMFIYVAEKNTAQLQGYALKYDGETWSVSLGAGAGRIAAIAQKPAWERVHSLGRVLGDRSVLYKYSNPNLLLVVAQVPDPLHKGTVHRRARATPLAVHTDNSLAYVYYNDKHRRTEVATMELYEGKTRWSEAGTPFSSLSAERAPHTERLAYILSAAPTAASPTRTERALTDKHMPWALLEPRRPAVPSAAEREEGLVPYAPELPLPAESVLNYNVSLHRVRAIHTAPSGLESTSLVLATGLDVFYTRVAPSKTFDLLKDDFDYYLITVVLAALVVATYSTKYFAARKMLKMAW